MILVKKKQKTGKLGHCKKWFHVLLLLRITFKYNTKNNYKFCKIHVDLNKKLESKRFLIFYLF